MTISFDALHEVARTHLPAEVAEKWTGLLSTAGYLRKAVDGGAGGGAARGPAGVEWPVWEGEGPLSFVAAVDCGALKVSGELPLRTDGWPAFFYYDEEEIVDAGDPETWAPGCCICPRGTPSCRNGHDGGRTMVPARAVRQ